MFWHNFPKALIKKSLLIAGAISSGALVLSTIGVIALLIVDGRSSPPQLILHTPSPYEYDEYENSDQSIASTYDDADTHEAEENNYLRPPARSNFLIAGLDDHNLTDVIIVGSFYRDTGDIKMMSVPRDMYTRLPEHRLEQMRAEGLRPPTTMKINALRVFGGRNGIYYLKHQLGEMLGVEFHYYVEVDLAAFRRIVDAVGGVYINVPIPMFYNPEDQDLVINLSPGLQHLNGEQAEGFVRFRRFTTG
ncbi:MAG: LCP family protein, partial [Defluviitaleaceae bacterium]|nr:LCP family protein [Defluviitaleaceae bacterium]